MAYLATIDERYLGTFFSSSAGTYDAYNYLNEVFVLAENVIGYGFSTDLYLTADEDVYSMGLLSPGVYTLDVDATTWDFSEFGFGAISAFHVVDSAGRLVGSSYSTFSDITFSVETAGSYYALVKGPAFSTEQYSIVYYETTHVNYPAIFSNPTYSGSLEVGGTISSFIEYVDLNGNSDNVLLTGWFLDDGDLSNGIDIALPASSTNSLTLEADWVGKTLYFSKGFFDDAGHLESSWSGTGTDGIYRIGTISNPPLVGEVTISGTLFDGEVLSAELSGLADSDGVVSYSYQWYRDNNIIDEANSNTYSVTKDDIGSALRVVVSVVDGAGNVEVISSELSSVVLSATNTSINGKAIALTDDPLLDGLTSGYAWELDASRTLDWSISSGYNDEYWIDPEEVVDTVRYALSGLESFIDVKFNYLGQFDDPTFARANGSEINFSVDGNGKFFVNDDTWAIGHFPSPDLVDRGDIYLNINSRANELESYAPGSQGYFLLLHELGHALGLKHPHDDAGNNRPTFQELELEDYDQDYFSVMSYNDMHSWDEVNWDPATFMFADVLALQSLYGQNTAKFSGSDVHKLTSENSYKTLWDPSGNDTISVTNSDAAWLIALPNFKPAISVDASLGLATTSDIIDLATPEDVTWLLGDFENIEGSAFDDVLTGNDQNNTLSGQGGDDYIYAQAGDDIIHYEAGADLIYTGDGYDVVNISSELTWGTGYAALNVGGVNQVGTDETVSLEGKFRLEMVIHGQVNYNVSEDYETINEIILTSDYENPITNKGYALFLHDAYSGFHEQLVSEEMIVDDFSGKASTARLFGISDISGSSGDDIIDLTSPDYSLANHTMLISGGEGDDIIWGSDASESIGGNSGEDVLFGGAGTNTLTGGSGADEFQFTRTSTADTVTDFNISEGDTLKFFNTGGVEFDTSSVVLAGESLQINYSDADSITILLEGTNLTVEDLSDSIFVV